MVVDGDLNVVVVVMGSGVLVVEDATMGVSGAGDYGGLDLKMSVEAADGAGAVTALAARVTAVR